MNDISTITAFFGWCTLINVAVLAFATIMLIAFGGFVSRIHAKLFSLEESSLAKIYFKYLAYYKLGILLFNLTPYLALKLLAP